jgi:HEAT repeat protein
MVRISILLTALLLLPAVRLFADEEPSPPTAEEVLEQMKDRAPAVRLSGTVDAAKVQDKAVTAQLLKLLKDKDYQVRMAAVEALRLRKDEADRKKAASAIASRLPSLSKRPVDEEEYRFAIEALHDLAQEVSLKALLDLDLDEERGTAQDRLMAAANVPSAAAIEGLIDFLAKGRRRGRNHQRQFAAQALRYATGENLGQDPDAWRSWWRDAKKTFSFEEAAARRAEHREKEAEKRSRAEERARRKEERERKRREGEGDEGTGGEDG